MDAFHRSNTKTMTTTNELPKPTDSVATRPEFDDCQCGQEGWTAIKCCNFCGLPKRGEFWAIQKIEEIERERDQSRMELLSKQHMLETVFRDRDAWKELAAKHCRDAANFAREATELQRARADARAEVARLRKALEWALDHAEESAIEERKFPGEFSRMRKEYDDLLANDQGHL